MKTPIINLIGIFVHSHSLKMGTWLPVGSKSSLPNNSRLKIANKHYVVWNNPKTFQWSLLRDACPHRLAPLSQGRVDAETGCIECPYHGWQFSTTGDCNNIPQSADNEIGQNVESINIIETGDILWGEFPIEGANFNTRPDIIFPELKNVTQILTRELPYSFDFMVENFMDPAHIPFAHHGLQGVRSDGINIPMKILTSKGNSRQLEIHFIDRIMGKMRAGIVSFTSPIYYHFRTHDSDEPDKFNELDKFKIQLMVLMTPVSSGITRIHLAFMNADTQNKIPKWISHSFGNKFLESDVWLHNCEIETANDMKNKNITLLESYCTPTTSDIGPVIWRKWWLKHLSHIPIFSNKHDTNIIELTPKQQRDRTTHIETCKDCQKALHYSNRLKKLSFLSVFLISKYPICSASFFTLSRAISHLVDKMIYGETPY
tara:strand:- start:1413 stop:2702 length:1290 start_codon:yes stop_codon:yes gene_type:complete